MDNKKVENIEYWRNRPVDDTRKDWPFEGNWISGYWESRIHPHRLLILEELRKLEPFESLLEIGCNCGPNLAAIQERFPNVKLCGIDVNADAIAAGKDLLKDVQFGVAEIDNIPYPDKSIDILLTDAVLIYVEPEKIQKVLNEMIRVAKKAIILVEWNDDSLEGIIKSYHWARNYAALLRSKGLEVVKQKIRKKDWPSKNWYTLGWIYTAKFPVQ